MTTIHYSGTELFMGAGLICRQPGDYSVQDVTAETLLANEPELFSLAAGKHETAEAPEGDEAEQIGQESQESDEGEGADTTPEHSVETTNDSNPETDEGIDEGTDSETEAPEATQEPSKPSAPTKSLSKMNKTELEALAAQSSVEVDAEAMTADQMRGAIKAAQDAQNA